MGEDRGIRDVQGPQVVAPKGRAGGEAHGHLHNHAHGAIRQVADHSSEGRLDLLNASGRVGEA